MLTLMLLRHAKAEPHGGIEDIRRRLTEKGEADAGRLGAYCVAKGLVPDVALVSASQRTRMTFDSVAASFSGRPHALMEDGLYNASARVIRNRIGDAPGAPGILMLVGHNPGIMEAAIDLACDGDIVDLGRLRNRFPPCGLAVVRFDADTWGDVPTTRGRLDYLVFPEDLDA